MIYFRNVEEPYSPRPKSQEEPYGAPRIRNYLLLVLYINVVFLVNKKMTLKLAKHIEELERALRSPKVRRDREALDSPQRTIWWNSKMYGKIYSKQDFLERLPASREEKFERYTASDF